MIIYKTVNLINGKFYIGKDAKNDDNYLGSGTVLKQAISKYGKSNFKKEVLEVCTDLDHLAEREIYWIEKMKAIESGYNIAQGGVGGDTGGSGGFRKGNIPWNKGLKGVMVPWNKGLTGVMKPNSGTFKAGKDHKLYGLKQSQSTIDKKRATRLKNGHDYRVTSGPFAPKRIKATCNGDVIEFDSIKEASQYYETTRGKVRHGAKINQLGERELLTKVNNNSIKFEYND